MYVLICVWDVQDYRGKDVDLNIYKGKILLVVNVASKWFFPFPSSILFITLPYFFEIDMGLIFFFFNLVCMWG